MNKSLHNNMDNDMNKEDMDKKTIKHSAILAAVVLAAALTLTGCAIFFPGILENFGKVTYLCVLYSTCICNGHDNTIYVCVVFVT